MNKSLFIAISGIAIAGIGFGLVTPVTVILLENAGTPEWINGAIQAAGYISIVIFSFFSGKLIDRFGVKQMLVAGYLLYAVGSIGHIFWYNLWVLVPMRMIASIGGAFIFVSTEVLINLICDDSNRGRYIGWYVLLLSLGIAIGTKLIPTMNYGDWVPFTISAGIVVLIFLVQFAFINDIKNEAHEEADKSFSFTDMPFIGILSPFIYGLFEASIIVALPLYCLRSGFTEGDVSNFLFIFQIGSMIILYILSVSSDNYNKYNMFLLVSFVLSILFLGPIVSSLYIFLAVVFFLMGGVIPSYYTIGLNYTFTKVSKKNIAPANGYFVTAYGLGTITGPLIGAQLIGLNKDYGYWIFASVLSFIFFSSVLVVKLKENGSKYGADKLE